MAFWGEIGNKMLNFQHQLLKAKSDSISHPQVSRSVAPGWAPSCSLPWAPTSWRNTDGRAPTLSLPLSVFSARYSSTFNFLWRKKKKIFRFSVLWWDHCQCRCMWRGSRRGRRRRRRNVFWSCRTELYTVRAWSWVWVRASSASPPPTPSCPCLCPPSQSRRLLSTMEPAVRTTPSWDCRPRGKVGTGRSQRTKGVWTAANHVSD